MPIDILRISGLVNICLYATLFVGSIFLFYGGPDAYAIRSFKELWNLGHVVYFGLLVYLLWRGIKGFRLSRTQVWLTSLVLTLVWGGSIELLQYGSARSLDMMDISRDFLGSLLALGFIPGLMTPLPGKLKIVVRCLILAFAMFHLSPLVVALSDEAVASTQFPVLSNFETPFELDRWKGNSNREVVNGIGGKQGRQLRIDLNTQSYSGTGLKYLPSNWLDYRALNLNIYYAEKRPLSLTVRVHDFTHQNGQPRFVYTDRFNQQHQLIAGWNKIRIDLKDIEASPKGRKMDMSQIADVSLFASNLKMPATIYLDRIYLSAQ